MAGKTGRMLPGALEELFRRSISPSPCPCKGGKTICEFKADPEISKYGDLSEKGKLPLLSQVHISRLTLCR